MRYCADIHPHVSLGGTRRFSLEFVFLGYVDAALLFLLGPRLSHAQLDRPTMKTGRTLPADYTPTDGASANVWFLVGCLGGWKKQTEIT